MEAAGRSTEHLTATSAPTGSAARVVDTCVKALGARPAALIVDLDGTISPIAPDPGSAFVLPGCREALGLLAERLDLVGVLTGRRPEEARALLGLDTVDYWGAHGVLHLTGGQVRTVAEAVPFMEAIDRINEAMRLWPVQEGILIETKGPTVAVHYRQAADPGTARQWLLERLQPLASDSGLELLEGRMAVEVRPPHLGKGWCVQNLVRERGLASIVYFGDDLTDAEAFAAIHLWRESDGGRDGVTVAVANPEAPPGDLHHADFTVGGVRAVETALLELAARVDRPSPA